MKNSIMKKTWGILLGFGVSLATAAFVLTGCDIEVKEKETSLDTALVAKWYYGGGQTAADNGTEANLIFEFTGTASASGGDWAFISGNALSGKATGSYSRADNEITLYSSGGVYLGYLKYTVSGTVLTLTNASNDTVKVFEGTYYKAAASNGTTSGDTDDLIAALGGASYAEVNAAGDTVTLKQPVSLTGSGKGFTIPDGVTLVVSGSNRLTLGAGNTYVIDGTLSATASLLDLSGTSGTITISGDGTIERSSTSGNSPLLTVASGQTVSITDVTVKGYDGSGNPVIANSGTLTLNGAKVTGNTNSGSATGGGIKINSGTVTLEGGAEVYGNTLTTGSRKGGGVYLAGGDLKIKHGTVYGGSSFAVGSDTSVEDAGNVADIEDDDYANLSGSASATELYGDAIYWVSAAHVYVYTTSSSAPNGDYIDVTTLSDFSDYAASTTGSDAGYSMDVSIHVDANKQYWNKAAR